MKMDPERVLIWGGERIGDSVMAVPALKLLKSLLPGARITYATTDYAEEFVALTGLVEEVVAFRFKRRILNLLRYRKLRKRVRSGAFDRVFVFGKGQKFARKIGPYPQAHWAEKQKGHQAEKCARAVLDALGQPGLPIPPPHLDLPDSDETTAEFASLGLLPGRYLVLHPACNHVMRYSSDAERAMSAREWSLERFREVHNFVRRRFPGMNLAVVGTQSERERIRRAFGRDPIVNLSGRTSVRELLQLLRHSRLLLCLDSGVMHLASVVGCPVISLWGPSNEDETAPFGLGEGATLLRAAPRDHPDSMAKIQAESVCSEIVRRVGGDPGSS